MARLLPRFCDSNVTLRAVVAVKPNQARRNPVLLWSGRFITEREHLALVANPRRAFGLMRTSHFLAGAYLRSMADALE